MNCPTPGVGLDICPTRDQIVPQLIAMLPRGRAWGTHDGGPYLGTTAYGFWTAIAEVWAEVNARICALAPEFFCATANETRPTWMEEYGLPDGCDPYPDLCTKVAAIGSPRCEYWTAIAARAGWSITCTDINDACGVKADNAYADCAIAGDGLLAGQIFILVSLSESPAYTGGAVTPALADLMVADGVLTCPPDLSGLECLLARIVGAHIQIIYGTTQ